MLLGTIHRTIEYVIKEGAEFEALLMNEKRDDPRFVFLFDNRLPAHVYYRWKLYSILNGDSPADWKTESFRLFEHGSLWIPPPPAISFKNCPVNSNDSFDKARLEYETKRGRLSERRRQKLKFKLSQLCLDRDSIADCMIFCIDNADGAEQIIEAIVYEATRVEKNNETVAKTFQKLAYLFLIGDILFNCGVRVANASYYRKGFEIRLEKIFEHFRSLHQALLGRIKAEQFKFKVMACLKAWENWAVYPNDLLSKLRDLFLGVTPRYEANQSEEDIDGKPMSDDDYSEQKQEQQVKNPFTSLISLSDDDDDIDGKPFDD